MVNHGLSTGALFLLVGMIYEQTHTRELKVYGGLWKITPIFGSIMLIVALINSFGTSWVFAAHAVFGRVFFFIGTVALYWWIITRPTVTAVAGILEGEPAEEVARG